MYERKTLFIQIPKEKTIDINFDNVEFGVSQGRKGTKQIIKGVSGKFKSGELTAIMGPSGAGKTSLLNILTGFQKQGVNGTIKSIKNSGTLQGIKAYRKDCCYILQDNQLAPLFTVNEMMNMAANLKLGEDISLKRKKMIINDILDTISLSVVKDIRCNQLSGGQKKRLSIALELINNPPIMFFDEPTTGLDSSSSAQCINVLKNLAQGGRTIICTIHQPSASLYEMFDHIYVMAQGKCIYQGANEHTVNFLSSKGLHCPQYHNPADYILEVASGEYGHFTDILEQGSKEKEWRTVTTESNYEKTQPVNDGFNSNYQNMFLESSQPTEWKQFCILVKRSFTQLYRDWTIFQLKLVLHFLVGIVLGLNFYNAGNDGSKCLNNVKLFVITPVYLCYTSVMPAILKFPSEIAVLKKEHYNRWYKLKTYYVAASVIDIPSQISFSFSYVIMSYYLSGQPLETDRFFMVLFICILLTLSASSLGLLIGSITNPVNGTFIGAILVAALLSFGGCFILYPHMSNATYFLSYFSFFSYGYVGLVQAVYGFNRATLECPEDVEYCHLRSPTILLRELGMDNSNYWCDFMILLISFILLRVTAFCTLRQRLRRCL